MMLCVRKWLAIAVTPVVVGLVAPLGSAFAAEVFYVSPTGSDGNDGLSPGTAWATLQRAADQGSLGAGDVVNVAAGTYDRIKLTKSGASGAPINFRKYGLGTVTIEAAARWQADAAVLIDGASHVVFDGIDTRDSGPTTAQAYQFGYRILNSSGVTVRNARTEDHGVSGLFAQSSSQIYFRNNLVMNCGTLGAAGIHELITIGNVNTFEVTGNTVAGGNREGIDAKGNSVNGLIQGNTVYGTEHTGIYIDGHAGQLSNVTVNRNRVYGGLSFGMAVGAEVSGGTVSGVTVTNNLIYNNRLHGLLVTVSPGLMSDILIANNTVYRNGYDGTSDARGGIVLQSTSVQDIRILNNVISDNKSGQIGTRSPGQTTVANNVSYGNQFGSYWGPTLGSPGLDADPLFEDAASATFRLQNNSPAKDYGTSTEAPVDEFTGAWRVGPNDAGAFEGTTALTATAGQFEFWGGPTYGSRSVVSVTGMPFSDANQVNVTSMPPQAWQIGISSEMISNVSPGDRLRVTFWGRVTSGTGEAQATFRRTDGVAPHSLDSQPASLTTTWQKFSLVFDNTEDTSGPYQLAFRLGAQVQIVQIGGVALLTYGPL